MKRAMLLASPGRVAGGTARYRWLAALRRSGPTCQPRRSSEGVSAGASCRCHGVRSVPVSQSPLAARSARWQRMAGVARADPAPSGVGVIGQRSFRQGTGVPGGVSRGYAKGPTSELPVSASLTGMIPSDSRCPEHFGGPGPGTFVPGPADAEPRRRGGAGGTKPQKQHGQRAIQYEQTTNNDLMSGVRDGCRARPMSGRVSWRIFADARQFQGRPAGCSWRWTLGRRVSATQGVGRGSRNREGLR